MGATQSAPRKITVFNEDATGVIKISDSVVQRLKEELETKGQQPQPEQRQQQQSRPPPPQAPPQQAQPPPQPEPTYAAPPPPPQYQHQQQAPPQMPPQMQQQQQQPQQNMVPTYVQIQADPSLSALKVRAEKEAELVAVEGYWQQRVKDIRTQVLKEDQISEETFKSTMEVVDKLFMKSRGAPICQETRHLTAKCYEQNKMSPLLCAEQVKAFATCVDSMRLGRNG